MDGPIENSRLTCSLGEETRPRQGQEIVGLLDQRLCGRLVVAKITLLSLVVVKGKQTCYCRLRETHAHRPRSKISA